MNCPICHSDNVHRSRHRNQFEAWRKRIFYYRLYRCHDCEWRGWIKAAKADNNTSPHYRLIVWLAIVIFSVLAFLIIRPYLE